MNTAVSSEAVGRTARRIFGAMTAALVFLALGLGTARAVEWDCGFSGSMYNSHTFEALCAVDDNGTFTITGSGEFNATNIISTDNERGIDVESVRRVVFSGDFTSISAWRGSSVYDGPFSNLVNVTEVSIPNSVTEIGYMAFYQMYNLTSISIPGGVTEIGGSAFKYCTKLRSVTIPEGVESIGVEAFYACSSLTVVRIPNSVTSIGREAFRNNVNLLAVSIGSGVETIGQNAFYNTPRLSSVIILAATPPSGGSKSDAAFTKMDHQGVYNDPQWSDATLSVPSASLGAYKGVNGTNWGWGYFQNGGDGIVEAGGDLPQTWDAGATTRTVAGTLTEDGTFTISGAGAMGNYSYSRSNIPPPWVGLRGFISKVVIEDGVTSVGSYAFNHATGIKSVTIPDGVKSIGRNVFEQNTGLTTVRIPGSVDTIGNNAFERCDNLVSVISEGVFPPGVGNQAFLWVDMSKATLYVPASAKNAYAQANGWKDFTDVKSLDEYVSVRPVSRVVDGSARLSLVCVKGRALNYKAPAGTVYKVRLVDMRGKTAARFSASGSGVFSLARLPAGRYFVEARAPGKVERASVVVGVR